MIGTETNKPHAAPTEPRSTPDTDSNARQRRSDRETADLRVIRFPAEQEADAITQYL